MKQSSSFKLPSEVGIESQMAFLGLPAAKQQPFPVSQQQIYSLHLLTTSTVGEEGQGGTDPFRGSFVHPLDQMIP